MWKIHISRKIKCLLNIDYRIYILGIISLCIILIIGLDLNSWMLHLNISDRLAKNLNEILLNLSYSIVSAIIFFIIVNHIPYYQKWLVYNRIIIIRLKKIKRLVAYFSLQVNNDFSFNLRKEDILIFFNPQISSQYTIEIGKVSLAFLKKVEIEEYKMQQFIKVGKTIQYEITEILKLDNYINSKLLNSIEIINIAASAFNFDSFSSINATCIISEQDLEYLIDNFLEIRAAINSIKSI